MEGLFQSKEPTPLGEDTANTCCLGEDRYIPAVGRFLIVCTFLEDALRIITQWNDQLTYLKEYRKSMSRTTCTTPSPPNPKLTFGQYHGASPTCSSS